MIGIIVVAAFIAVAIITVFKSFRQIDKNTRKGSCLLAFSVPLIITIMVLLMFLPVIRMLF